MTSKNWKDGYRDANQNRPGPHIPNSQERQDYFRGRRAAEDAKNKKS